jgi:hypothetical protein
MSSAIFSFSFVPVDPAMKSMSNSFHCTTYEEKENTTREKFCTRVKTTAHVRGSKSTYKPQKSV